MLYQSNDISLSNEQLVELINRSAVFDERVPEDASVEVVDAFVHIRWSLDLAPID